MKKVLYFLPAVLLSGFFIYLLFLIIPFSENLEIFLPLLGVIALFLVSGFLMAKGRWYGCLPSVLLGTWVIYLGVNNPTPVIAEIPIGIILAVYYLICAVVAYRN